MVSALVMGIMKPSATRNVIIAALDRTAASDQVVYTASSLARMIPGSEIHLLHVVDAGQPPGAISIPLTETLHEARTFLDEIKEEIAEQFTGRIVAHLTTDLPSRYIVEMATELGADLVVVGTAATVSRLRAGSTPTGSQVY